MESFIIIFTRCEPQTHTHAYYKDNISFSHFTTCSLSDWLIYLEADLGSNLRIIQWTNLREWELSRFISFHQWIFSSVYLCGFSIIFTNLDVWTKYCCYAAIVMVNDNATHQNAKVSSFLCIFAYFHNVLTTYFLCVHNAPNFK